MIQKNQRTLKERILAGALITALSLTAGGLAGYLTLPTQQETSGLVSIKNSEYQGNLGYCGIKGKQFSLRNRNNSGNASYPLNSKWIRFDNKPYRVIQATPESISLQEIEEY
jgi:hypothetical protein